MSGCLFDVRAFHSNAPSYCNSNIPSIYRHHEQEKKQEYSDRVREVEKASFTPLVFVTTGGMGGEATVFYRRLADLLSRKSNVIYSTTLAWMRCTLSFSLLWSAAVFICGSRSISYRSIDVSPEVGLANGPRDYWFTINFAVHMFFIQLSSTWHFCARGGGKDVPSTPA